MSEQEIKAFREGQRRLRCANYQLTDNREIMCRVCDTQILISTTGIRVCKNNVAFVTCGGTCDYFKRKVVGPNA